MFEYNEEEKTWDFGHNPFSMPNGGMEALKRKKGSKGQSKLTDEEFLILDKAIQENNLKTAKEVKHIIETCRKNKRKMQDN